MLQNFVNWCVGHQDFTLELGESLLVAAIVALVLWCPAALKSRLRAGEAAALRFHARHRLTTMLLIALVPIAIRIALLPLVPVPIPYVSDEFSHLLLADTFAAGRITNPPHPLAQHFETTYVTQQRVYASVYPPAHGLVMGIAKMFGLHPFFGVLAEVALLMMAMVWMLEAWVPPRWMFLGALLALIRLGMWMTSYWGGALTAVGGVLILGSIRRLWQRPQVGPSILLGLGLMIVLNTRPYEGLLVGIATAAAVGLLYLKNRFVSKPAPWSFRHVGAPLGCALALGAALTGYYNWRLTESPLRTAYYNDQTQHGTPTAFIFQSAAIPRPALIEPYRDLSDNYESQRAAHAWARLPSAFWKTNGPKLSSIWHFYLHPLLALPLLALPWVLRRRANVALLCAGLFVSFGTALYPFYFAHYSAPVAGILILLVVEGVRQLAIWSRRRPGGGLNVAPLMVGSLLSMAILATLFALILHRRAPIDQPSLNASALIARQQIENRLTATGEKHLVLVRYGPQHIFHFPAIANRARIDDAAVVWARELDAASNATLLRYFKNRQVWMFEPDETPPQLVPLTRSFE